MRTKYQSHYEKQEKSLIKATRILFALVAVAMMVLSPIAIQNEAEANSIPKGVPTGSDYGFVITEDAKGVNILSVEYSKNPKSGSWTTLSTLGYMDGGNAKQRYTYDSPGLSGVLKFDPVTGLGPFNSFYAAMNVKDTSAIDTDITKFSTQAGRMAFVLNPLNLTESLSGKTFTADYYNVMLFIPAVFWYSDGLHLYMSNNPDFFSGGKYNVSSGNMKAYAHTVYKDPLTKEKEVRPYIALGVYEAYVDGSLGADNVLRSMTGVETSSFKSTAQFREIANNLNKPGMGGEYMLWNYYQWTLYKMMSYTVMGNKNAQITVGKGLVNGALMNSGFTADKAPYYGTESGSVPAKLFLENAWGGDSDMIDDFWSNNKEVHIGQNRIGTLINEGSSGFDPNIQPLVFKGHDAEMNGGISGTSLNSEIWDLPIAVDPWGTYDKKGGIGDKLDLYNGQKTAIVGGYNESENSAGLARMYVNDDFSTAKHNACARLAYISDLSTITFEKGVTGDADSTGTTPAPITKNVGERIHMLGNTGGLTNKDPNMQFFGWTDSIDYPASGHLWDDDDVMLFPVLDLTLYSYWQYPELVTLSFDLDGGSLHMAPLTLHSGEVINLPGYHGEKKGYKFIGWYEPDSETIYPNHGHFRMHNHDVELKAVWEKHAVYEEEDDDDIIEILQHMNAAQRKDSGGGINAMWLVVAVAAVAVASAAVLASTWIKKRSP